MYSRSAYYDTSRNTIEDRKAVRPTSASKPPTNSLFFNGHKYVEPKDVEKSQRSHTSGEKSKDSKKVKQKQDPPSISNLNSKNKEAVKSLPSNIFSQSVFGNESNIFGGNYSSNY